MPGSIEYRIAYIALSIQNNEKGQEIVRMLKNIANKNLAYIQFGSAEWFWERSVNSVVIQVESECLQRGVFYFLSSVLQGLPPESADRREAI